MRDSKFRGVTTKGEMIFGSLVIADAFIKHMPNQHTKTWIITSAFGNGGWFNIRGRHYVKQDTVGEFTGLTDKNGVDIYEGDTLRNESGRVCIVAFNTYLACFDCEVDKRFAIGNAIGFRCADWGKDFGVEVIGNIHQEAGG